MKTAICAALLMAQADAFAPQHPRRPAVASRMTRSDYDSGLGLNQGANNSPGGHNGGTGPRGQQGQNPPPAAQ
jgi:hypothetical protein